MFECGPDVAMLHAAVLSAKAQLKECSVDVSSLMPGSPEAQLLVNNMCRAVTAASSALKKQPDEDSDVDNCNRRLHSVVLYATLQSVEKNQQETPSYFESVADIFPTFSWDTYLEVTRACNWENYYVECVQSLPVRLQAKIIDVTLQHCRTLSYLSSVTHLLSVVKVALHSVLQTLLPCNMVMCKTHPTPKKCPSSGDTLARQKKLNSLAMKPMLSFFIEALNESSDCLMVQWEKHDEPTADTILKSVIFTLWQVSTSILESLGKPINIEITKPDMHVLGHWKIESRESVINLIPALCGKAVDYGHDSTILAWVSVRSFLKFCATVLESTKCMAFFQCAINEAKVFKGLTTWSYPCPRSAWTTILVNEMNPTLTKYLCLTTCQNLEALHDALQNLVDENDPLKRILHCLQQHSQCCSQELIDVSASDVNQLIFIIEEQLPRFIDAIEHILRTPNLLENMRILECFQKNAHLLGRMDFLKMLLDNVGRGLPDIQQKLIEIFLGACKSLRPNVRQQILCHRLQCYGLSDVLKLKTFSQNVTSFLNQAVQDELAQQLQVVDMVFGLCIQSPQDVLQKIIVQAIDCPGKTPIMVMMVQQMMPVCHYQTSSDVPGLFVHILKQTVFHERFPHDKVPSVIDFIQRLLKVDTPLFSITQLLLQCVIPYLHPAASHTIQTLSLHLFQVVCVATIEESCSAEWFKCIQPVALVLCFCQLDDYCFVMGDGQRKESLVQVSQDFMQLLQKLGHSFTDAETEWLLVHLKNMNHVTKLSCELFWLKHHSDLGCFPVIEALVCARHNTDDATCNENIPACFRDEDPKNWYSSLVTGLATILPSSTVEEWRCTCLVLKRLLESNMPAWDHTTLLLPSIEVTDFQVIIILFHMLVDVILLLSVQNKVVNWPYLLTTFSKILKEWEKKHTSLIFTAQLLIEVCRLAQMVSRKYNVYVAVPLLDLATSYHSTKVEAIHGNHAVTIDKLVATALETMPDKQMADHVWAKLF